MQGRLGKRTSPQHKRLTGQLLHLIHVIQLRILLLIVNFVAHVIIRLLQVMQVLVAPLFVATIEQFLFKFKLSYRPMVSATATACRVGVLALALVCELRDLNVLRIFDRGMHLGNIRLSQVILALQWGLLQHGSALLYRAVDSGRLVVVLGLGGERSFCLDEARILLLLLL